MIPKKYCSLAFVLYKFLLVELDPDLSYYIPLEKRKFGCRWEPALDIFHESRTFCGANLSPRREQDIFKKVSSKLGMDEH